MGLTRRLKRAREEQGAPMATRARKTPDPAPDPIALFNEIMQFVLFVKSTFTNEPGKYQEFLAIVYEYKSIGVAAVLDRIKLLFCGHPDLLRSLDVLFPSGYEPKDDNNHGQEEDAADIVGKAPQ